MLIIASTHKRVRWNPLKDIINSFITIEMIDISLNHPKYYNYNRMTLPFDVGRYHITNNI